MVSLDFSGQHLASKRKGASAAVSRYEIPPPTMFAWQGKLGYIGSVLWVVDGASNRETYVGAPSKVSPS